MRFKDKKDMNLVEQIADKFGAVISSVEYGTMSYMNLTANELQLIFTYEQEKARLLQARREEENHRRREKAERRDEVRQVIDRLS